jgi:hypothetical protein
MTNRNRVRLSKLSLALALALAAAPVFAQSTSAALGGRISDATGQPVSGADVSILHTESGTVSHVTTDADGRYVARGLRVGGPYTITVTKDGKSETHDDVYLQLDETANIDAKLDATTTTLATVQVTGSAPSVFSSDNKGLGTRLTRKDLDNAPMPNRSIQNVARLDPRINVTDRARGEISALGQNSRANNISIDAVGANDPFGLEANGLPYIGTPISVDTIQEYDISTANYDVTNRRSVGANINAVTKSGTNDFHGSAYYSFRDAKHLTSEQPSTFAGFQRDWTSGLTLGGPILQDKLFFFLGYEESKIVAPGPDFGPSDSSATNRISNVTQADLDRIISIANGYGLRPGSLAASAVNTDSKRLLGKLDWNINDDHRLSFRYNRVKETEPVINGFSNSGLALSSFWYSRQRDNKNYVVNAYDNWNDNFSTEASLSYTDYGVLRNGLQGDQPQIVINLGPNNTNPYVDLGEEQFSHYNVLGVKTWNGFLAGTYYAGDHTIKAGFDFQQDKYYNLFGRTEFGAYTFNGIDNFASGNYHQFDLYQPAPGYTLNDVAARWTLQQYGFFAQDSWQATPKLALQYGFRYDLPKTGDAPLFNACFASAPVATGTGPANCPNGGFGFANNTTIDGNGVFQPRFSFNYSFDGDLRGQLRGGLGLFQGNTLGVWLTNPYQNNGLTVSTYSIRNSSDDPAVSNQVPFSPDPFNQNLPPPRSSQQVVDTLSPDFKQPTVWKASLAFDHELPFWGLIGSVEWQGLKVRDAIYYRNLNIGAPTGLLPDGRNSYYCNPHGGTGGNTSRCNANPTFGQAITVLDNTSKGNANFVTLSLKKPFGDDWSASVSYTHGKATEVNPGTSSQASSNYSNNVWVNPNENVASTSNYSIRDRFNASVTWQHDFFGDYKTSVSMFYDGHSGQPYSWAFGNDANGDSYARDLVYVPRPGDVLFKAGTSQSAIDQFYAFIANTPSLSSHAGSIVGRNDARAPWVNQMDLSFRQEIPGFGKGQKGEFRLDFYNFLNALNKNWGREERIGFPFVRTLANYEGVDAATGKYIYSLPVDNATGNYAPGQFTVYDDKAVSRWSILATVRYSF